ncbi:TPR-like protein [Basidiobolus meristosporus CBS 931.73]|uniref:TPR-like protein n=1 Tax=Basidiobolus meristosporus CBS 931.73 TaxID=1314790 RepID=A0A1Y1X2I9_9FUNG|nr:TPR-like protein [Basidiobolus meristosporus CBS 931.73]|eukprot:ORX79616.1 TPR-like protein [Basidiobolus meristosporus CBS 931.73]
MFARLISHASRTTNPTSNFVGFSRAGSKNFTTLGASMLTKRFEQKSVVRPNWATRRSLISVRQTAHPTPRLSPFVKKWFVYLPLDTLKVIILGGTSIFLTGYVVWKGTHIYIEHYAHPTSPNLNETARKLLRGAYVREEVAPDPYIAVTYLNTALKIASEDQNLPDNSPEVTNILVRLGRALHKAFLWDEAIETYERAWKAADSPETQELRIRLSRYLGDIHMRLGNYQEAEKYLVLGIQMSKELREKNSKLSNTPQVPGPQELGIMVAMANMYALQQNYEYALPLYVGVLRKIKEYKEAQKLDTSMPIKGSKEEDVTCLDAIVMGHLAEVFYGMKKNEEAISWAKNALKLAKKGVSVKECEECASVVSHNLGLIYEIKDDKEQAFSYFVQAVSHATTARDKNSAMRYRRDLNRLEQELAALESEDSESN